MEQTKRLEELNKESLQELDDYIKTLKEEHHEAAHKAKDEWQAAWTRMKEALMVLERIEI